MSMAIDRLKQLMDSGAVKLGIDVRKMNSPGSPVYDYWPNLWPAGTILVAALISLRFIHLYVSMAVLAAGMYWWLAKIQPRIRDRVYDRTAALVLGDERLFDGLWIKGVLSLYAKLPDGTERAATRRDDWRAFVNSLPEDL